MAKKTDENISELIKEAKIKVQKKMGFYRHSIIYIVVNSILVIINLLSTPDVIWSIWSILGWGVGLLLHFIGVFYSTPKFISKLEEKMIQKELKRSENKAK